MGTCLGAARGFSGVTLLLFCVGLEGDSGASQGSIS